MSITHTLQQAHKDKQVQAVMHETRSSQHPYRLIVLYTASAAAAPSQNLITTYQATYQGS